MYWKISTEGGSGGGQMGSVLAVDFVNPSSNLTGVYTF